MNDLTVFTYCETPIRTVQKDEQTWWVLADVCKVLDIANPRNVTARLDDDEKGVRQVDTPGGAQNMTVINEPGLYSVILRSDKPEAKAFKRWVTHEVLPEIRRKGSYGKQDNKLEVAKLIASCKSATAVKGILSLYGVSSSVIPINCEKSVTEYLNTVETWELTEIPCKHIYEDYVSFCSDYNYSPLSLSMFSKAIHRCSGLMVRRRRVNGELVGFYI